LSSYTHLKEIELMQKIAEFDSKALEELYERYSSLLYVLIKKILKDDEAAENVLTDVFAIIWKKIDKFNFDTNNVYTWLVTLARNKAIDQLRRTEPSAGLNDYDDEYENEFIIPVLSPEIEPINLPSVLRIKDDIETALNDLTDAQQYVIYLTYYDGLTQGEIASRLNIPLSTVKSKIKIALSSFWQNLKTGDLPSSQFIFSNYIIPYSLGSLDKEDLLRFKEFHIPFSQENLSGDENSALKELGEYQNLVSLLPAILNFEDPPVHIKNSIAKKLYRMREEVRSMRLSEVENLKSANSIEDRESEVVPVEEVTTLEKTEVLTKQVQSGENGILETQILQGEETTDIKQEDTRKENKYLEDSFNGFEEVKPRTLERDDEDEYNEENGERNYLEHRVYVKEKTYVGLITIVLIFIFIVVGVIAYMLYKEKTDAYEFEINRLNQRIDNIITENKNRIEFTGLTTLNNSQTLTLNPTYVDSSSNGKIIYSQKDKRGYLHIFYLPPLAENRAYQLWGNISGEFISLLVFRPSRRAEYYPFTFPTISDSNIGFLIAESSSDGFKRPGRKVYLTGTVE
jgi:RNA polymerase sigma-70 factor (ECF subfamily)